YTRNFPVDSSDITVFQAYVPFGAASPSYAGRFYSNQNERIFGLTVDFERPYGKSNSLRLGMNLQTKNRGFNARVLGYVISNFQQFDYDLLLQPQSTIFDTSHINEQGFRMSEITNPSDSYRANSFLFAPYVMLDQYIGNKFRITGGLRFELYRQKLLSTNFGGTPIKVDSLFSDFLPSINLAYSLGDHQKIRLSVSRTVNRPNFRELAPFTFFDFNLSAGIVGNDTITPSKIWNMDLRYEIFPGANQMLSVTAFYKQFKSPIEQFSDAGTGGTSRQFTFANVPEALDLGVELEARFRFPINQNNLLFLNCNAAYIYSQVDVTGIPNVSSTERPLQGQSPYVVNLGLNYRQERIGFEASLLYNQIGRRIWQVGYVGYNDVWESSRPILDFQLTQKLGKNGEIKLNLSDILNQPLNFYQDINGNNKFDEGSDNLIQRFRFGTNVSLNLSYKF
ncbi:TonB-dependent receptor, partial [bacterium]|nr:TonB-dependent receptor [bacterium]